MSLYKDYLAGYAVCQSKVQKLKEKVSFWQKQRQTANKIRNIDTQQLEVHNKKELWKAINNNRFYRACF